MGRAGEWVMFQLRELRAAWARVRSWDLALLAGVAVEQAADQQFQLPPQGDGQDKLYAVKV